jgi:hypothetical protein
MITGKVQGIPDLRAALHGLRLAIQLDALEAPSDVGRLMHSTGAPSSPAPTWWTMARTLTQDIPQATRLNAIAT